jgi:PAS domain S-box-containing protein
MVAKLLRSGDTSERTASRGSGMDFDRVLTALPAAVLVLDAAGSVVYINPPTERMLGRSAADVVGRAAGLILDLAPPDIGEWTITALATPSNDPVLGSGCEALGKRADGSSFPVYLSATPKDDHFVVIMRDVANYRDQLAVERATNERIERLLGMVRVIPWEADVRTNQMTYVGQQAEAILGYPVEEWYTYDFWPRHIHPDDRDQALATCQQATEKLEHYVFSYRMIAADGRIVWIDDIVAVARWRGAPRLLTGYMLDVTDRKASDEQREELLAKAEAALRVRDEFLSIASHELRTPITSLRLVIQSFPALLEQGRDYRSALAIADRQSARLQQLGTQLLDMTRIDSGTFGLTLENVDLAAIVRGVVDRYGADIARAHCKVSIRAESVVGLWDGSRLDQVVTNLLVNAVKFGANCPIEIILEGRGDRAILTVTDHGIGISLDRQHAIFNRFGRAVSARHYGGFGMGLFIARRIVDLHGGTIAVRSQPSSGATFIVELPREPHRQENVS